MKRFDNDNYKIKKEDDKKEGDKKEGEKTESDEKGASKLTKMLLGDADLNLNLLKGSNILNSGESIAELGKKMNGGIPLKNSDLEETKPLGIDAKDYANDKKPSSLRDAQRETYELINTVNTLKDTLTTLSPVLEEGKKLMEIFESFRI